MKGEDSDLVILPASWPGSLVDATLLEGDAKHGGDMMSEVDSRADGRLRFVPAGWAGIPLQSKTVRGIVETVAIATLISGLAESHCSRRHERERALPGPCASTSRGGPSN